ncbi:MAG TPA: glycosyl hydrolase family 18 protein [Polyangiaceae bacterium]
MRLKISGVTRVLCLALCAPGSACSSYGAANPGSAGAASVAGAPASGGADGAWLGGAGGPAGGAVASGGSAGATTAGAGATGSEGGASTGTRPKLRTVGYLPSYRGKLSAWATSFDFSLVSYVDVCFASVDASGSVSYPDQDLATFAIAAHKAGAKVCMALGGASTIGDFSAYSGLVAASGRAAFVQKITDYAVNTGLDCIDVDFEGPKAVNADYEGFVTALSASLKAKGKETSAAVASWFGPQVTNGALQAFDFVNVMAYDLHNPGGSATPIQSSSMADAKAEIDYWVGRGLPKEKAVFGVPFYGYRWKPGAAAGEAVVYSELLSTYGAAAGSDTITQEGTIVYLNSKATIVDKTQLAATYGGIMAWELGQDAPAATSLLRAIHDAE